MGMKLKDYLQHTGTSQTAFAVQFGVSQSMVWQWISGYRPVPAERCLAIERATGGLVTRADLRPDASLIWPDIPTPGENPHKAYE